MRDAVSVSESARGVALWTPAFARAHQSDELASGGIARVGRPRGANHHMRDIAFIGDADFAELEDEKSVITMLAAERCIHFRPARPRNERENTAATELLA